MSRSGYSDDCGGWDLIRWRGAVASALRGERGQVFLRTMLEALDRLPEPRLIESALVTPEGCCALGAVAVRCKLDVSDVDPYEREQVAERLGIAEALAAEVAFVNDEQYVGPTETPEQRFARVRAWVVEQIAEPKP